YGGLGVSIYSEYRQYKDEYEILGNDGEYWIENDDKSKTALNALGGVIFYIDSSWVMQIGAESQPTGITIGFSRIFSTVSLRSDNVRSSPHVIGIKHKNPVSTTSPNSFQIKVPFRFYKTYKGLNPGEEREYWFNIPSGEYVEVLDFVDELFIKVEYDNKIGYLLETPNYFVEEER
ncbi:MAG: hypothetical protein PF570_10780, partial [Candidatus Cloacimonetes bacterium]|nr:hypothetical protein [Candidatus Cloacimonadota bacterium]